MFTVEADVQNGPYFSKYYVKYYHLGISPDCIVLDLDYDLYYLPWYNPIRLVGVPYLYYIPKRNRQRKWNKCNRNS